jgi:hypothetical protein
MSRIVLLTFNYETPERVKAFANELAARGVEIDVVVSDRRRADNLELDPRIKVHAVMPEENRLLPRRMELLLVYKLPGGVLARARALTGRSKAARPLDATLAFTQRVHQRLAGIFHGRLFMPVYRNVRPLLLARKFRSLTTVDVDKADGLVAGDITAVALGWRLARRHQGMVATTALDVETFAPAA